VQHKLCWACGARREAAQHARSGFVPVKPCPVSPAVYRPGNGTMRNGESHEPTVGAVHSIQPKLSFFTAIFFAVE
jgi:hypothetical protein